MSASESPPTPIADLHAHPSLKIALWDHRFEKRHRAGGAWNPFCMRVDLPKLEDGGVRVLVSAVYLPEPGLLDNCIWLRLARNLAPPRIRRLFTGAPFERTLELIAGVERAVERANGGGAERCRIVRSATDLDRAAADGVLAIVHAIEGAHSLGEDPRATGVLARSGVRVLTLAHFFPNAFVNPVTGIPPGMRPPGCFGRESDPAAGLTPLGVRLVEALIDNHILIDLAHCTPTARERVFDLVGRRAPLVFSHVGVRTLLNDPMNPTDEEIRDIAETGGVIGVILMNYWLGEEASQNGLVKVVETVRHIARVGGVGVAAIGTDFDGFTDPPDDLKDPTHLPRLFEGLTRGGFTTREAEQILYNNATRVLREGW
jgi:membrane dipeptidase